MTFFRGGRGLIPPFA